MSPSSSPPLLPRGIRNNNPGNIRLSSTRWQGQRSFQFDPVFVEFTNPIMGVRALARLLLTYHFKHGLDTVAALINRYAPPSENATDVYIRYVARRLQLGKDERLDLQKAGLLPLLARAIVRHENGQPHKGYPPDWYDMQTYTRACDMAVAGLINKEKA